MGNETTRDVDIHNVYSKNNAVPHGFVVAGMGELDGVSLRRFYIDGGNWRFGCNFEWGSAPVDPSIDGTLNNGRHPYNIHVEEFHGFNLYDCEGFLRTASAYNCKFLNCSGYNVKSFIYCYSGDKGIARYSQNISFENCISKVDGSTFTMANNAITISIIDTLNGTALPSWTNYDQFFEFINCRS